MFKYSHRMIRWPSVYRIQILQLPSRSRPCFIYTPPTFPIPDYIEANPKNNIISSINISVCVILKSLF